MIITYSLVPIDSTTKISNFIGIIEHALMILNLSFKNPDYFTKSENIEFINRLIGNYQGKYLPGGRTVLFSLKFFLDDKKNPLILKIYNKFSPIQILHHTLSVKLFNQEFETGLTVKNTQFKITPSKNLTVSYSPEFKCVILIQEFSNGFVPHSKIPLSSICKIIGKKGYVIDFFVNNWRILDSDTKSSVNLNYIDILFSNKIVRDINLNKMSEKLKSDYYSITNS